MSRKKNMESGAESRGANASRPPQSNAVALKPQIEVVDRRAVTSSVAMAEFFGKSHKHVLEAIRDVVENCPADFNGPNFRLAKYTDAQGKSRPCYHLTRDAFSLVAMGFTGKKAMAWKVAYINAFNAMERALMRKPNRFHEAKGARRSPFAFCGVPVRAREIDGQGWVSAMDMFIALDTDGYSTSLLTKSYHVQKQWVKVVDMEADGKPYRLKLISMPAVVQFCTRCRDAKQKEKRISFMRWIVDVVFPKLLQGHKAEAIA